jgi:hypothetical protein
MTQKRVDGVRAVSRIGAVMAALSVLGALLWTGCGPSDNRYYCDNTGCYSCDGYGCSNVTPPSPQPCTGNASCGAGAICTNNGCEQTCQANSDCPRGDVCTNGLCVAPGQDGGTPHECTTGTDCGAGKACVGNKCQACGGAGNPACPCTTTTDCTTAGDVCVANACTPNGCNSKADCGTGMACVTNHCQACGGTNGPCPCGSTADCSNGEQCVAGACTVPQDVCKYNSDCDGGKICADGQCVAQCSATMPCDVGFTCNKGVCDKDKTGQGCTSDIGCPTNAPHCVGGQCVPACTMDSQCTTGDYCDQGACVLDTRPKPNCTTDTDCNGSASAQHCIGGYCRYACTSDNQCKTIDARIGYCAMDMVCRTQAEAQPMCTTQAQCPAGQDCIGNVCK